MNLTLHTSITKSATLGTRRRPVFRRWLISSSYQLIIVAAIALLAVPAGAAAQMMSTSQVEKTARYTLELTVGPAETMVSLMDAMMAPNGEVMVSGGAMDSGHSMTTGAAMGTMPDMGVSANSHMSGSMTMANPGTDQGMPVNHHLEVHVTQNDTGAVVNNVTPIFRVTDKLTGQSRDLPQVMAMYGVQAGQSDFHYGQNVYLPDGTYQVAVMIGSDAGMFRDIIVTGGAPMPSMPMAAGGSMTSGNAMTAPGAMAASTARDGRSLSDQPAAVQSVFMAVWGDKASLEWVTEHNASLGGA